MPLETTDNQLSEIARRIREMRWISGLSTAQMAQLTEVSEEQYLEYEGGKADLPFTFMHKCALAFGVDVTNLVEGHSAKLTSYTVTRRGTGASLIPGPAPSSMALLPPCRSRLPGFARPVRGDDSLGQQPVRPRPEVPDRQAVP